LHGKLKKLFKNVDNSMPLGDANGLPREAINRDLVASSLKNMNCQLATKRLTYHQFTCIEPI
jgi:hypothetical protein